MQRDQLEAIIVSVYLQMDIRALMQSSRREVRVGDKAQQCTQQQAEGCTWTGLLLGGLMDKSGGKRPRESQILYEACNAHWQGKGNI